MCAPIVIANETDYLYLDWNLSVEVKITEMSGSNGEDMKVLLTMKASLDSTMTNVLLSQPILIRPVFLCSICFGPFPCEHRYRSQLLKRKMRLISDIVIKIQDNHDDDDYDGDGNGLIWELHFNMI